jgi:hypothetical protein
VLETELYPPIKAFLEAQGYDVKAEIGCCDVVARRGEEPPVIVEMKTSFTLSLLYQGIDRQAMTDAVYIAIPEPKQSARRDMERLCKRLGLGLLTVHGRWVEALLDPAPYAPRKTAKRTARLLKEFNQRVGDYNLGGSTKRPLMTAYRQDALRCAHFIHGTGAARVVAIQTATAVTRAPTLLRSNVYGWFNKVDRGTYSLSPTGQQALHTFSDFILTL